MSTPCSPAPYGPASRNPAGLQALRRWGSPASPRPPRPSACRFWPLAASPWTASRPWSRAGPPESPRSGCSWDRRVTRAEAAVGRWRCTAPSKRRGRGLTARERLPNMCEDQRESHQLQGLSGRAMTEPTPLLDLFRRGEVARDVRLLAAQGVLAPRAHEQLEILILLLEDPDPEIRTAASETVNLIPEAALKAFLARSDVRLGTREFFADRGVFPAETPAIEADEPLIDTEPELSVAASGEGEDESGEGEDGSGEREDGSGEREDESGKGESDEQRRLSVNQKLATMSFTDRLKAAAKGSREMRAILIRDSNKLICATVLSSPKVTTQEVEGFSRMANVAEEVLRIIGSNRAWMKNYGVAVGLTKNPKTPLTMSLNLLGRLNDRDLAKLSMDRNVPEQLRVAARRKVVAATSKK